MNMNHTNQKVKKAMSNKEYRDGFVEEHIRTGIPFQIRALREKEQWTQKELGQRANKMAQERICVLEDPDYSKFTISTLQKLASAFDVGLMVRFVPFSRILLEEFNLPDTLTPDKYNEDGYFHDIYVHPVGHIAAPDNESFLTVHPSGDTRVLMTPRHGASASRVINQEFTGYTETCPLGDVSRAA